MLSSSYTAGPFRGLARAALLALLAASGNGPAPGVLPSAHAQAPRERYPCAGSIAPDNAAAGAEIRRSYADWRSRYVTRQGAGGALRVRMPGYGRDRTSSEAIGYGMLLAVYLDDRPTFDALWRYARRYRNPRGLMSWEVTPEGRVPDPNAATDGDQDMAFALVVADARWGGYRADAGALLRALLAHAVEPGSYVLKPGDVWGGSQVTNPSYFSPAYYRIFATYTGDSRWLRVADAAYRILDRVAAKRGAATGLLPGWTTASGDSARGGKFAFAYDYGAARIPWRLAMDAAWHCDRRARRHLDRLNAFFRRVGAQNIREGYTLEGRPLGNAHSVVFVGPAAAGALLSPDAGYRRAMWAETVRLRDGAYYGDSLRLLALLFASGRMQPPRIARGGADSRPGA
ncbi:MAG TPA: glycosyl hydrolase family 8 [Longimicrobiaceae bacterium]|nr:glycosyl hydrolase family 8 [Longimicrobiaceae bacterium]